MRFSWMILYAVLLHLFWGAGMMVVPPSGKDAAGGVAWNAFMDLGGPYVFGPAMIVGAVMAIIAMKKAKFWWSALLLIPQQILVTIGVIGCVTVWIGISGDDFSASRIVRSSAPSIMALVCHTGAIVAHLRYSWR